MIKKSKKEIKVINRFRGALLGLACGDAVGTTVEFKQRGSFNIVTDMIGGGPFDLEPGQWTDDTSMALCLATSLLECDKFNAKDQMEKYCLWMDKGYLSSNGKCFDIGNTTYRSLFIFKATGKIFDSNTDPNSSGNGCLMRLAPVPMYFLNDVDMAIKMSGESSRTTHGSYECIDSCRIFGSMLVSALSGCSKNKILFENNISINNSERLFKILQGKYTTMSENEIKGSGYVVESLEAALWCFFKTTNFRDAILMATNLGDDSDTTAAICGQIAGAYYGIDGIPDDWLNILTMKNDIMGLADKLYNTNLLIKKGN